MENNKAIGLFSNTGSDPLENYNATKPAFKAGPSSARQLKAIQWRFAGGFLVVHVFGNKMLLELDTLWQKFLDSRMGKGTPRKQSIPRVCLSLFVNVSV